MGGAGTIAIYASLALAGLAGSLHCIGMCGPLLVAFSRVFTEGRTPSSARFPFLADFTCYHAGRIWTYGLLGLLVGAAGGRMREMGALAGLQRPTALLFSLGTIAAGLAVAGALPLPRLEKLLGTCGLSRMRGYSWFALLVGSREPVARLLLGALMGLLPCGLVYGALVLAATLPGPAHAALGMLVFGAGTVPSLSAVLWAGRSAPRWLRLHGTRAVGLALIIAGCVMAARALLVAPGSGCPACAVIAAPETERVLAQGSTTR